MMSRAGLIDYDSINVNPVELVSIQDGTTAPILKFAIDHGIEIGGDSSNTKSALLMAMNMLKTKGDDEQGRQDGLLVVTDGQSTSADSPCDKSGNIVPELEPLLITTRIAVLGIGPFSNKDDYKCLYGAQNPDGKLFEVDNYKELDRKLIEDIIEWL